MTARANSIDGRTFSFETPLADAVPIGSYVTISTDQAPGRHVSGHRRQAPAGRCRSVIEPPTYPELVLFVDDDERAWFESIDGRRTCGQIGAGADFFERLWGHDLIVVDAASE